MRIKVLQRLMVAPLNAAKLLNTKACSTVALTNSGAGQVACTESLSEVLPDYTIIQRTNGRDTCPRCLGEGCRWCGDSGQF
jgi:hypothetical protein